LLRRVLRQVLLRQALPGQVLLRQVLPG